MKRALAGRSKEKLEAVRAEVARGRRTSRTSHPSWPTRGHGVADAIAKDTRVVCTTVPGFVHEVRARARRGVRRARHELLPISRARCPSVRDAIDRHDARAKETGARIVCCCGFD